MKEQTRVISLKKEVATTTDHKMREVGKPVVCKDGAQFIFVVKSGPVTGVGIQVKTVFIGERTVLNQSHRFCFGNKSTCYLSVGQCGTVGHATDFLYLCKV